MWICNNPTFILKSRMMFSVCCSLHYCEVLLKLQQLHCKSTLYLYDYRCQGFLLFCVNEFWFSPSKYNTVLSCEKLVRSKKAGALCKMKKCMYLQEVYNCPTSHFQLWSLTLAHFDLKTTLHVSLYIHSHGFLSFKWLLGKQWVKFRTKCYQSNVNLEMMEKMVEGR